MTKSKGAALTDAGVKRLPSPEKGSRVTYDTIVKGFGANVTAAGHRSFVLNYHTKAGRERRITLGEVGNWTVGAARIKARELKRQIEDGGDPLGDIEDARQAPTVWNLCDRFDEEHLVPKRRSSTVANYRLLIAKYIKPHFHKDRKVAEVSFEDVDALHRKISRDAPYQANWCVAVLSKMFSLAVRWKMRDDNPCKGIEKNNEVRRQRYLSGDELTALTKALAAHADRQAANIIRLLLLTGARRGEILGMRWADLDLTAGVWSKPASSTKQGTDHVVPLSAPARMLLTEIRDAQLAQRRTLGAFVFPSISKTGYVTDIKKSWASICKAAGISGLRIHDLRHSFASQLVSSGASLPLIGALLGHSNPMTTSRYAHLFQDPQRAAVERVAAIVDAAGKDAPEPTPFKKKRGA